MGHARKSLFPPDLDVFSYIELEGLSQRGHAVEVVDVRPPVLERTPPALNHRVGNAHLCLRNNPVKRVTFEKFVHDLVEVLLYAGVDEHLTLAERGSPRTCPSA